jgi:aspartyl-tRNA(Asn)/glutamyl-tRNA(Gln) amidotransferase subunit B
MVQTGKSLSSIISEQDLGNVLDESKISSIIDEVLQEESNAVAEIKEKPETLNYLVGRIMKKTKGKSDPAKTLGILKKKLSIG